LSALGTAQLCRAPTKPDVDVPAPLPYELEPVDGSVPEATDEPVDALVDVTVDGVSGESTGTLAAPLSESTMPDVVVVAVLAVVAVVVDAE
jgi:hypothetical protein